MWLSKWMTGFKLIGSRYIHIAEDNQLEIVSVLCDTKRDLKW